MAKKSKADWAKEGDEVKAILDKARSTKKELACAMLIAEEGIIIEVDLKNPALTGDKLFPRAKKRDGATQKGFYGKLSVAGNTLNVMPECEVPGGFDLKLKKYLSDVGLKLKPEFAAAGTGDSAAPGGAAAKPAAAEQAERKQKLDELEKGVAAMMSRLSEIMARVKG
jgi:hypothetical protein